jgi:hypothetical protein
MKQFYSYGKTLYGNQKLKVYCDCDGVLTDFKGAVKKLGPEAEKGLEENAPLKIKQKMWDAIEKAGESFWSNMEWTPDGKDLWELLKRFNPILLSSPGKFKSAPSGKTLWVKNNVPGTPLFLTESKSEYVDPYELSILIDDNKNNIGGWEQSGGKGILHTNSGDTERKFLELLWATPEIDISKYF